MMGHKSLLNLWQSLSPSKGSTTRPLPTTDQPHLSPTATNAQESITARKEFYRRCQCGCLGLTVPLSLGIHGLALRMVGMFSGGYFRSQAAQQNEEEVLINVSVTELPEVAKMPEVATADPSPNLPMSANYDDGSSQTNDSIAALPTNAVPLALSTAPSEPQHINNTESAKPNQVATAGNLAPETQPEQPVPKSAPTPVAPSPISNSNLMQERILTSNNSQSNSVPALPNVGGGTGKTASLYPTGTAQIGRGLGWGNMGSRGGNPLGNGLNPNQIGLFSGKVGVPWGVPMGGGNARGNGNSGNSGNGSSGESQSGNANSGSRGRIRCQECSKPQYPDSARERRLEGAATVAVDIAPDGSVTNVRIMQSSGHPELDEAAVNAARGWRFEASATGRQAVPGRMNFQIEGSEYAQRSQQIREQQASRESLPAAAPLPTPVSNPANTASNSVATPSKPTDAQGLTNSNSPQPLNNSPNTNPLNTAPQSPATIPSQPSGGASNAPSNNLPPSPQETAQPTPSAPVAETAAAAAPPTIPTVVTEPNPATVPVVPSSPPISDDPSSNKSPK